MATLDEINQKLDIIIELLAKAGTATKAQPARVSAGNTREQKKIENVKLARDPIPWQSGTGMFLRIEMQSENGKSYYPSVGARNNVFETGEEPLTWREGDVISFAGTETRDENGKTVYWADVVKRVSKAPEKETATTATRHLPSDHRTPEEAYLQAMEAGATPPELRKPKLFAGDADLEDVPF